MASCTTVDTFTLRPPGNDAYTQDLRSFTGYTPDLVVSAGPGARIATIHTLHRKPVHVRKAQLVLEAPCEYVAGDDIRGRLPKGPLATDAIGIPAPSNAGIKQPIRLIQVGDLAVQQYDIKSYIGVERDGTFVPNIILHSDVPGAPQHASANASIRFTPRDCRYSTELIETQAFVPDPTIPPSDTPVIYRGPGPAGLRFTRRRAPSDADADARVIPAKPGQYHLYGLRLRIVGVSGSEITYSIGNPLVQAP